MVETHDAKNQEETKTAESLRKIRHVLESVSVLERFHRTDWKGDPDIFPFLGEVLRLHEEVSTVIAEVLPWAVRKHPAVLSEHEWTDSVREAARHGTQVKKAAKKSLNAVHTWLQ